DGKILCTNPDRKVQVFVYQEKENPVEVVYVCKNADGSIERLHCIGEIDTDECTLYYSSSKNPAKIKFKVIAYTLSDLPMPEIVQFPGSSKNYTLEWLEGKVLCTNPNKTVQVFVAQP
ncbi:MAG: hypothetical protein H7Y04_03880, partial [Verrucomicrobia bacterium]|nr:hypothetical protein [Cytophagales bacterium]